MAGSDRIDRRAWLARAGATVAGLSGVVVALGARGRLGIVTSGRPVSAQVEAQALRVNLGFVSAYVVVRGGAAAVVDTGVPGSAEKIGEVIAAAGLDWSAVGDVILTHQHPDHAGSAEAILERTPGARVWLGEADIPAVRLSKPIMPAADGDDIFGLKVVATPGHTAGHISLLDPVMGVLFTGDSAFNTNAALTAVNPQFTADTAQANASFRKMSELSFDKVMFGHGEPIESGGADAFKGLAATLP
jgi:glyoxylase-like metal-dependent hydrolase (beta-lactamase superfamily II)